MDRRNAMVDFDIIKIITDTMVLIMAFSLNMLIFKSINKNFIYTESLCICIIFYIIFILLMIVHKMYNITTFYYMSKIVRNTLVSSIIPAMMILLLGLILKTYKQNIAFLLTYTIFSFVFIVLSRFILIAIKQKKIGNGYTHALFIGRDEECELYSKNIEDTAIKMKIDCCLNFCDQRLQDEENFEKLLIELKVNEVIIVQNWNKNAEYLMKICDEMGITTTLILDFFEDGCIARYVRNINGNIALTYHTISLNKLQLFIKSLMDFTVSLLALILTSPILLAATIAIKVESPGPVFFKQKRVGKNGKTFMIIKFRSMCEDAEVKQKELFNKNERKDDYLFKIKKDPRITRVGKFMRDTCIDELPQFINVLKGDMSLVGTRPPTVNEVAKYKRRHRKRICIKPGITGMWQVYGKFKEMDFDEVVELDVKYIENWSIFLDLKLLFKTVEVVLARKGSH